MGNRQFRVLYREFLFRIADFELLSTRGDLSRLLGQVGAMLAAASLMLAAGARRFAEMDAAPEQVLISAWPAQHFLIATTMLVVGLLTVLSWDSLFPDRRDVLVLAPLPVRLTTLFGAKLAAMSAALAMTVLAVNVFTGISYPLALGFVRGGFGGIVRSFAAYWLTAFAAGAFVFCLVLGLQGAAQQVFSRRIFLRVSGFLQLLTFFLLLTVYFLQPSPAGPGELDAGRNQSIAGLLPSYWFLGLFHELNGTSHTALAWLGGRAIAGLAAVCLMATVVVLLAYHHAARKVAEEPDITPGSRRASWAPSAGDSLTSALLRFTFRTLLRSRQHRLIFAFYLGLGFSFALGCAGSIVHGRSTSGWNQVNGPLLAGSIVLLCFHVLGTRMVCAMPVTLQANWIFRVTATRNAAAYLAAVGRTLRLSAVPAWAALAAAFLPAWPLRQAVGHAAILGLIGLILADLCMHGFRKIPFTCSYLPGKANLHVVSGALALVLIAITDIFVQVERRALLDAERFAWLAAVLCVAAMLAWRRRNAFVTEPGISLRFEESPEKEIHAVELHRDGR